LIGKRFVPGASGPDAFDCWGLVTWVYARQLGLVLPEYPLSRNYRPDMATTIAEVLGEETWERIEKPVDLCAVVMGATQRYHHVGIWIAADGGLVLHATRPHVIAQKREEIQGMPFMQFYRLRTWPQ
jgi:cell wall-associated NlpC family hydrolase